MFNSADCLHYLVSWLFSLSKQLIVYMIKSADCLHYHQLIWQVFQVATTGSSGPSSLMGVRFAYSAMEQALPHIVEEVRIKKETKTNKSSYLMLSRFLYMYIRSGVKVNGWFYWKLGKVWVFPEEIMVLVISPIFGSKSLLTFLWAKFENMNKFY